MSDWNKNLGSNDFYEIQFNGYIGWDKIDNKEPYFVMLEIIKNIDKSSHKIGVDFDDISHGNFHWRDWTKSSLPFVDEGEIYWAGFTFQFAEDAKKFVELYVARVIGWMTMKSLGLNVIIEEIVGKKYIKSIFKLL